MYKPAHKYIKSEQAFKQAAKQTDTFLCVWALKKKWRKSFYNKKLICFSCVFYKTLNTKH